MITDNMQETHKLAAKVAEHMEGWHYDPTSDPAMNWPHIKDSNGGMIRIHGTEWMSGNKLHIVGIYPTDDGRLTGPRDAMVDTSHIKDMINVSSTKTPDTIAHDITRRLLPGYLEGLEIVKTLINDWQTRRNHAATRMSEVASYGGGEVRKSGMTDKNRPRADFSLSGGWANAETSDGESYCFDIKYVSHAVAVKIAAVLHEA